MFEQDNFSPFCKIVSRCPAEDEGLIGPIKSKPHFEKGSMGGQVVRAWLKDIISKQIYGTCHKISKKHKNHERLKLNSILL
jgi:hypothetical protein